MANYIATGLIIWGSFSGEGGGVLSALIFVALGQVVLLILFMIYQAITKFDIKAEIKKGNAAAGLAAGGILIALAVILRASLAGPFVSWTADLIGFGISAAAGIILLLVMRLLVDWLFLPNTTLQVEIERDQNVAAIAITEAIIIAVAIIISSVI
ncbi:MAG: DUF350 domain-containing protein, partial [bacterium]|nr:DUF350 domain-containing protein [bacterium]